LFKGTLVSKMSNMTQNKITVLKAEGLAKSYGKRAVVKKVSLELRPGEIVGLLGPNGAGKTTFFYMVVGLIFPDLGKIFINDQDVTFLPLYERAKLGVAYLPQESSLFRKLTVLDNIAMALEARGVESIDVFNEAEQLIDKYGLNKVKMSLASALSGGERRRCEIARCLAINPKFVLLDEPFAGIDPIAVKEIQGFVQELKSQGIGVLITDHNVRETLGTCDRGYLMRDGEIFFHGTPDEISTNSDVRKFYLGESFKLD
jgi:lipopolysaccharide export system ATP-binding protein